MRYVEFKKIAEATTLGRSTSTSVPGYITAVNNLLATNQPIAVGPEGIPVVPKPNQRLRIPTTNPTDLKNFFDTQKITTTDNKEVLVKNITKTDKIKGQSTAAAAGGSGEQIPNKPNRGNVAEGLFAIALYDTIKNGSTSGATIVSTATKGLPSALSGETELPHSPVDKLTLKINLAPEDFAGLKNEKFLKSDKEIQGYMTQMANFCNKEIKDVKQTLQTNQQIDSVNVIADGISDQRGSKVDVLMNILSGGKKETVKYEYSVKAGDIKQFGQSSILGGNTSQKFSAEQRFQAQIDFWEQFGINLDDDNRLEDDFVNTAMANQQNDKNGIPGEIVKTKATKTKKGKEKRITDPNASNPFDYTYDKAAKQLNANLQRFEEDTVRSIIQAVQSHARGNNPNAKVLNFDVNKYEQLDFEKLTPLLQSIEFKAQGPRPGAKIKATPEIKIYSKTGAKWKEFLTVRLYVTHKKITNMIEKEDGLTELVNMID